MMEIYILRHAIAEVAKPGDPDADRALTDEGREKLRRVLKRARSAGVQPQAVLSSPYRRAIETAEAAAQSLGCKDPIEKTKALLPDASPHDIWEEIRTRNADGSVLLASHEPLTSSLTAFLLGCTALQVDMKKAALVRLDADRFGPNPRCVLKWMLTPAVSD